jgi:hypothetical protein
MCCSRRLLSTAYYGSRSGMVTVKPGGCVCGWRWAEGSGIPLGSLLCHGTAARYLSFPSNPFFNAGVASDRRTEAGTPYEREIPAESGCDPWEGAAGLIANNAPG